MYNVIETCPQASGMSTENVDKRGTVKNDKSWPKATLKVEF